MDVDGITDESQVLISFYRHRQLAGDVKRLWRGRKTSSQIFRDLLGAASMNQEPNISLGLPCPGMSRFRATVGGRVEIIQT